MIRVLHQCGHNATWNRASFEDEGVGNGLILSPVHQTRATIEAMPLALRQNSLFDPQFYLPRSRKRKLHTYDFFPEQISGGFETVDFPRFADEVATRCLRFQVDMQFSELVIPTRHYDQLYSDYIQRLDTFTVQPFVRTYRNLGLDKSLLLTLVLTSHMVRDAAFRNQLLDWVTSIPEVSGVYLIPVYEHPIKPVTDAAALTAFLEFIHALREVDLTVVVGYVNADALLYTLSSNEVTVTVGAFENTRMFSVDKFVESDEKRMGPAPRLYVDGLLNWIRHEHALQIRNADHELWEQIYVSTPHGDRALDAGGERHFTQPEPYRHYFTRMAEVLGELGANTPEERYEQLRTRLREASKQYTAIEAARVDLDPHGSAEFIPAWQAAINTFARQHFD